MTRRVPWGSHDDGGFSLVELLVCISILGAISFGLTEAVIVGFKTTDGTVSRSGNSVTTQLLSRYFSADVQSASKAASHDTTCAPTVTPPEVAYPVIRLDWAEVSGSTTASYWLRVADPANKAGEQDLVRQLCTQGASSTTTEKNLGHFSISLPGEAVTASCDGPPPAACPSPPAAFEKVTLTLRTGTAANPDTLTVRRRIT